MGVGALLEIGKEISKLAPDEKIKILVISGKSSARKSGALQELRDVLSSHSLIFSEGILPNPDLQMTREQIDRARQEKIDLVIGIGGGSTLDVAKVVALVASDDSSHLEELLSGCRKINHRRKFLVAIPTTSGTASEVTPWSTLWDWNKRRKFSLQDHGLFPDLAIVDPTLMVSLPRQTTASTGMDALSHAIESCWSVDRNPISTAMAHSAMTKIIEWLPVACRQPKNLAARSQMALASLMAGIAFSQTKTAAAHSISYALTLYHNIPHGVACSITLPALLETNARGAPEVIQGILRVLGVKSVAGASKKLRNLMKEIGLHACLRDYGIVKDDLTKLAQEGVYPERMKQNPVQLSEKQVLRILEEVY